MILIVGCNGNMGHRYGTILNYLGVEWQGVDVDSPIIEVEHRAKRSHGILIATPTECHFDNLIQFSKFKKPILCEKPFTKNMLEMDELVEVFEGESLSMVFQYSELTDSSFRGDSHYNYFKHGSDGLVWDCIQIIGLARGGVSLSESSPIWDCKINGQRLNVAEMDSAYVQNVRRWLSGTTMGIKEIYDVHQKTSEFELNY